MKIHFKITGVDRRGFSQSQYEFDHQTACGYVRDTLSTNGDDVDCKLCLNSIHMINYHAINKTLSDSQGCY